MPHASAPALTWFRNDLRVHDQAALIASAAGERPVLCVFVLDEAAAGQWAPGGASRWWLHHSLSSLASSLNGRGVPLILRRGSAENIIPALALEVGATEVHAGETAEPWARAQEERVRVGAAAVGARLAIHRTSMLFDQNRLLTRSGGPFHVYSPFARACLATGGPPPPEPAPASLRPVSKPPTSDRLESWQLVPSKPDWAGGIRTAWHPGEPAARRRLSDFAESGIEAYAAGRDLPDLEGTSRLSPYLRWGEISPAEVWHIARDAGERAGKFIGELLWREFCHHLLWHKPHLPERPLRAAFEKMPWRRDLAGLRAWQRGQTGVPIVDAGMRQLWKTGWMHNRVRLITASFLVKHLLIDWRAGETWFWDTLVDADLANNSASWQWIAGSGADAAPFVRIFNPVLQARKFDPDGAYIKRFVPEISRLEPPDLFAPWEAGPDLLARAGIELGRTYPKPLVDLATGRARALRAFAQLGADEFD